jgi:glycosyltransferase involved in cell wall biosynthesis
LRVLFFSSDTDWTGRARAFAAAASALAARGHQVTYSCPSASVLEQRLDHDRYQVAPLELRGPWLVRAWRLRRVLLDAFVEVVLVHGDRDQVIGAFAARWAERAALVRRFEHGNTARLGFGANLALRVAATGLLFATEEDRRRAPAVRRARIEPAVAPLGIDSTGYDTVRAASRASLGAAGDTRLIVCAADTRSRVRAANVLRVVKLLAPRHPELRLAFVGPGSDHEDLRMHAAALRVTPLVTFLGDRDDAHAVLRAADLVWVVAAGDDAAYAYLDAQALKVPVLAERDPVAQRFVADGITGLLFPPGESSEMAATVARLLAHEDQRVAMGAAARARVARDFPEVEMADALERAVIVAGDRSRW